MSDLFTDFVTALDWYQPAGVPRRPAPEQNIDEVRSMSDAISGDVHNTDIAAIASTIDTVFTRRVRTDTPANTVERTWRASEARR